MQITLYEFLLIASAVGLLVQQPQLYGRSRFLKRVEKYFKRRRLSAAIEETLLVHHPNASVPHALAIHRLGGMGKSQLTLAYVEDHRTEYDRIL